jgi:hypothetical protein
VFSTLATYLESSGFDSEPTSVTEVFRVFFFIPFKQLLG